MWQISKSQIRESRKHKPPSRTSFSDSRVKSITFRFYVTDFVFFYFYFLVLNCSILHNKSCMYLYGSLFRFSYLSSTDIPHPRPLSPSSLHQKYYWKHLDKLGNWIHICIENLVTFEKYFKCNLFPNVLRNVLRTMCHARIIK